jgi:hypothetical protein
MGRKLSQILEESGIPMNYRVGGAASAQVTDREVRREPCPRTWILNYAKEARRLETMETDPGQQREYRDIAECLEWIADNPPRTFRETVQLCWTVHIAVLNEDAISGLSPGRLGQVLWPLVRAGHPGGTAYRRRSAGASGMPAGKIHLH